MGDSESKDQAAVPAWQQSQSPESPESSSSPSQSSTPVDDTPEDTLQRAAKFLQDDAVRNETRQKKAEFLLTKGISEVDIDVLLKDEPVEPVDAPSSSIATTHTPAHSPAPSPSPPQDTQQQKQLAPKSDHPPIVTYPEFLAKPVRPPPLITPSGFLNAAAAFAGLATLVHGTSRYLLAPMVDSLTDARVELHQSTLSRLDALVTTLEDTVSEVPPRPTRVAADAASTVAADDDPTELFHRDVGVQTLTPPPATPASPAAGSLSTTASEQQAILLNRLTGRLREIDAGYTAQADGYAQVRSIIGDLGDDLNKLRLRPMAPSSYSYSMYRSAEPDDEVKTVKENIRRVKGMLLSARSFPPPAAR